MFDNRNLRKIFGPERGELTGEWRGIHNEEISDLFCSPNIVRVNKSRIMRWAGHVTCVEDRRVAYRVLIRDI